MCAYKHVYEIKLNDGTVIPITKTIQFPREMFPGSPDMVIPDGLYDIFPVTGSWKEYRKDGKWLQEGFPDQYDEKGKLLIRGTPGGYIATKFEYKW